MRTASTVAPPAGPLRRESDAWSSSQPSRSTDLGQDGVMRPGQHNALTDVTGLRVGHAALDGPGALSGTTVVLAPPGGAVGGVDVRGSAPGT
ncbi:P1 family peptidase, partial [Pseudonocardia abyssalis]|uniref:P1 family peptidase n=1 Tax=Pseudonocardia abyssalis TaxID=2792008 RepID=UPI0027E2ACAF